MTDNSGGKEGIPPDLNSLGLAIVSSMDVINNKDLQFLNTDYADVLMQEEGIVSQTSGNVSTHLLANFTGVNTTGNLEPFKDPNNVNNITSETNIINGSTNTISGDKSAAKNKRDVFTYSLSDSIPLNVYIENSSTTFTGVLNAVKVGGIILTEHPEINTKIETIKSIGRNRVKVVLKDHTAANTLILSTKLEKHSLDAYIPRFILFRKGVVRGVSQDFDGDYIKHNIRPCDLTKFTVDSVARIERKVNDQDGNTRTVKTQSVIVTFRCSTLPKYISINKVRLEVEPYVQKVLLCYRCYRYGHMAKQCRSAERCRRCGGGHNHEVCEETQVKCIQCQGSHLVTQIKDCPEFSRQKNIKNVMSVNNCSYKEATESVPKRSYANVVRSIPNHTSLFSLPQGLRPMNFQNCSAPMPGPSQIMQSANEQVITYQTETGLSKERVASKRTRPSSPVDLITAQKHKDILRQHALPTFPLTTGSVVASQSNPIQDQPNNLPDIETITKTVLEVVIFIIEKFKSNQNLDIANMSGVIKDKLVVAFSDNNKNL